MAYSHRRSVDAEERLFVLNGELRGVSVPLSNNSLRVGSSADCDVVLLDTDGTEAEVSFRISDDTYGVSDSYGDVRVGRTALKSERYLTIQPGTLVKVGGVELMIASSIEAADNALKLSRRRFAGMAWAASVAIAVGFIGALGLFGGRNAVVAKPVPYFEQTSNISRPIFDVGAAAKATQKQLDLNGISRVTAFADEVNGTVKVRGRLRDAEQSSWRNVSTWFDSVYGGSIMLDAQLNRIEDTVTLPFSVNAVWMGQTPRLTLHDGSQRYAGDFLPGGWRLDEIASDRVTISKDGESLMVPL